MRNSPLTRPGHTAASPPGLDAQREASPYEKLVPYVHALVRRVLGSDSKEHDLVQDVLCLVLHHRHELRDDRQLKPWVRAITFNVVYSELRERRQHRAASQDLDVDLTANLEHTMLARDLLSRLRASIDRLPAEERAAFFLRFVERHTVAEIARLEGYSLATAHRRLRRPRRILRNFLAQHPAIGRGGRRRSTAARDALFTDPV